jgi:hypothetical protein
MPAINRCSPWPGIVQGGWRDLPLRAGVLITVDRLPLHTYIILVDATIIRDLDIYEAVLVQERDKGGMRSMLGVL